MVNIFPDYPNLLGALRIGQRSPSRITRYHIEPSWDVSSIAVMEETSESSSMAIARSGLMDANSSAIHRVSRLIRGLATIRPSPTPDTKLSRSPTPANLSLGQLISSLIEIFLWNGPAPCIASRAALPTWNWPHPFSEGHHLQHGIRFAYALTSPAILSRKL